MKAAAIMKAPVIWVRPETAIADAARSMLENHISGLPVVDHSSAVVGMLTEGDLLRRTETGTERHRPRWLEFLIGPGRLAHDYVEAHARKVGEIMSTDVVSVNPQDELAEVVRLMERRHIKRVPVLEDQKVIGIISRADLVRALIRLLPPAKPDRDLTDAEIRERILVEIDKQLWAPRASIDVQVKDGVVDLHGTVIDERERTALAVLIECIPGVKAIHDHLVWVEPVSGLVIGGEYLADKTENQ